MIEHDDRHLKQAFEALRRAAAAETPPFDATVVAARARRAATRGRRAVAVAAAVVVAVAIVALVVLLPGRGARDGSPLQVDLATVQWRAPTDFLLTLPGDELLRSVPQLGRRSLDRRTL